jgi:hypothetical protein
MFTMRAKHVLRLAVLSPPYDDSVTEMSIFDDGSRVLSLKLLEGRYFFLHFFNYKSIQEYETGEFVINLIDK